jgi:hypothetical protein
VYTRIITRWRLVELTWNARTELFLSLLSWKISRNLISLLDCEKRWPFAVMTEVFVNNTDNIMQIFRRIDNRRLKMSVPKFAVFAEFVG